MIIGPHYGIPKNACLHCGRALDGAICMNAEKVPISGDITVCFYCGEIMVFAEDLHLRKPTDAEIIEIAGNPMILAIQKARQIIHESDDDIRDCKWGFDETDKS